MKNKVLFIISLILFYFSINHNTFHLISADKFAYSENEDSETLIIGRLLNSEKNGFFADGMFPGRPSTEMDKKEEKKWIKKTYLNNETYDIEKYSTYNSQNGGQGILYSLFDNVFGLNNEVNFKIFRGFNALMLSFALSLLVYWCSKTLSLTTAIVLLIGSMLSPWLLMYGRSTWWAEWTFLLPFSSLLLLFNKNISFKKYYLVFSSFLLLKLWFNGFEFITTFLICSTVPFILYELKNIRNLNFTIRHIGYHAISTISCIIIYILIIIFQFKSQLGNFESGVHHILKAFNRRSSSEYIYANETGIFSILKELRLDVLFRYLGNNAFDLDFISIKIPFIVIILIGLAASIFILKKLKQQDNVLNIVIAGNLSFLAPASWFIIFNQHSHIHTHINFMIWYFPYMLFNFIFIGIVIDYFTKKIYYKE